MGSASGRVLRTVGRAIVIHDGRILLLRNRYPEGEFYGFPGGRQEPFETLEECAIRETKEETGIDCRVVKPLYLDEFMKGKRKHLVTLFFLLEPIDPAQEPDHTNDPDEEETKIQEASWMPLEKLKGLKLRPDTFVDMLLDDYRKGFPDGIKKLPTVRL